MTIQEAAGRGIGKLCQPGWEDSHIELYLTRAGIGAWGEAPAGEGEIFYGPWVRLYDPPSHLALGHPWNHYQQIGCFELTGSNFEEWIEPEGYRERYSRQQPSAAPRDLPHPH
ncbi:MAG TPA: hypothetical protein VFO27_04810 [Bryobacteraceae bacterium]|nr:hypothetical protein [Bryobacteraceae bacterium]